MVVFDVVENILLRSCVKDLVRCKSVCKSWYFFISSNNFAKAHVNHNRNNYNKLIGHTRITTPQLKKVPDARVYHTNLWNVVGSSNGLVCIYPLQDEDALILVNNPWTREVRQLPTVGLLLPKKRKFRLCLSFGYDSYTDDYKVVMGIKKDDGGSLVQVLSLKSNSWRVIGQVKYWFLYETPGILFNGALYWFALDCNCDTNMSKKKVILSFDISREEFSVIPQPDDNRYRPKSFIFSTLGIMEDHLCITCTDKDNDDLPRDIWVMRNYNVWELLPNHCDRKYDVVHYLKLCDCTSPKMTRMSFFCDDNIRLSRSPKYIQTHIFVPSLVSPFVNSEKPSHIGSDKILELEASDLRVRKLKSNYKIDPNWIVAEHERQSSQTKTWTYQPCEQELREMEEIYRLEGGENV